MKNLMLEQLALWNQEGRNIQLIMDQIGSNLDQIAQLTDSDI